MSRAGATPDGPAPSQTWRATDPWTRFGLISVFILLASSLVPESAGSASPSTVPTTSTLAAPESLGFDADQFLDRWNSIDTGTGQLNDALRVADYDSRGATFGTFLVSYPNEGLDWAVTVNLDPVAGDVVAVSLIGPLGDSRTTDSNSVGALMVIAAVEGLASVTDAIPVWDALLGAIPEAQPGFSVGTTTPNASFRLSVSTETLFTIEATP